jgi:NAD-dependent SIR2 family protein deacetylase
MTKLRIKSRSAPLGAFHRFIHRAFDENRVVKCLTRNFDGLETRDRPDLADRIMMVHGDNRVLRCSAPGCSGIEGKDDLDVEAKLLMGTLIECPSCILKGP